MVAAYHLLWTAYGHWLPNDPRGSMSRGIAAANIESLGELHYGRKQILPAYSDLKKFYEIAQEVLKYPLLTFTNPEIASVGQGLAEVVKSRSYTCYACAVMPDHVHLVIRKHRDKAEDMIAHFQEETRNRVLTTPQAGRSGDHPVWGGPGWKVFLHSQDDIRRTVRYVQLNPVKARRPPQHWPFVIEYDGWMPGLADSRANRQAGSRPFRHK